MDGSAELVFALPMQHAERRLIISPLAPYKVQFHSRALGSVGGREVGEEWGRCRGAPGGKASKNLDLLFIYFRFFPL